MFYMKEQSASPDLEISSAITEIVEEAKKRWGLEYEGEIPLKGGIAITTVRPNDVGHPTSAKDYWELAITTADTWQNWINTPIDKDAFVLVCGMFNNTVANPATNEIQITSNGIALPVINIDHIYSYQEPKMYLSKPIGTGPSATLKIQCTARVAQSERIGLIGYTIAKKSFVITQ